MPFTVEQIEKDKEHHWAVVSCACDLTNKDDSLITRIIDLVRRSYGETKIIEQAARLLEDDIEEDIFRLDHLLTAIRASLPDPSKEGKKPPQLTNYRSQAAEMVAKAALAQTFDIQYPVAPQEASLNSNQPVLGFDSWGLSLTDPNDVALVLIQVKATDEKKWPPQEANRLVEECRMIVQDKSKLCRALCVLLRLLSDSNMSKVILKMLEGLGREELPKLQIAPAIVRGVTKGNIEDLQPIRSVVQDYSPAIGRGVTVSIGASLDSFGEIVMNRARLLI